MSRKSNKVADALSSITTNNIHSLVSDIDYTALSAAQKEDDEMLAYRIAISGLVLEDV